MGAPGPSHLGTGESTDDGDTLPECHLEIDG